MWRVLLLSFLAVAAVAAHKQQAEADDLDDDLGLDEEELNALMAEEEEAMVTDEEQSDETHDEGTESGSTGSDADVSFQVGNGS